MIKKNNVFIVAEAGNNHEGDFSVAKKLIDKASESGADAIKFQTYITKKRVRVDSPIYKILKKCELTFNEFEKIKKYSKNMKRGFDV